MNKSIEPKGPVMTPTGIWYAYLTDQMIPGDGMDRPIAMHSQDAYGNTTLFEEQPEVAIALSAQSLVWVEFWFRHGNDILADRETAISINNGEQTRGRTKIIGNYAQAKYHGIFHVGETITPIVRATSDVVDVRDGYISVIAQPFP